MSMYKNHSQSSLTALPPTDNNTAQTDRAWVASALARFTVDHRLDLGMTLAQAAELSGLELSQWAALEAGWVPEDANLRRAIAATLQVDYTCYSFLATISSRAQHTC